MVEEARRRNAAAVRAGRVEIRVGDAATLPYPDESFDRAFSIHSIYFWERPADCLKELRRALKPGGLLAITIQPKDQWSEMQQRETDLRTLYVGPDLVQMFADSGFRDVRLIASPEPEEFQGVCVLGVK
jgi:ubiquinone/menaquinone biosynthesis C-methylase UbiE